MSKYFNDFTDHDQVMKEFQGTRWGFEEKSDPIPGFPTDDEILFAAYAPGCYSGDSVVLFKRDGKLFMNEASHCSCYGLEGQWDPSEVEPEQVLRYTIDADWYEYTPEAVAAWNALGQSINNVQ
jgi:hypothetical protein